MAWWYIGQGQAISVHHEVFYEMHRKVYFRVTENLFTVVDDGCAIDFELPGDPHEFDLIRTQDNSAVAILDYKFDDPLVVMYDVEARESWPCGLLDHKRDLLFEKLKQEHPHLE
jgi:hypothetical protein